MTTDDSRGPATKKTSPQSLQTAHSTKKKTSNSREQVRSEKSRLPGNTWEDIPADGQTHPAWSVANAAITAVAATKLRLRQRRTVRKQTWWARLTKTCRRMRTNARGQPATSGDTHLAVDTVEDSNPCDRPGPGAG